MPGEAGCAPRADLWQIYHEVACEHPAEFNRALQHDLARGQQVVALRLDTATRLGLDPDHARSDEVGDRALSLVTLQDVDCVLRGVDLAAWPVHVHAGSAVLPFFAMLDAWLMEHGQSAKVLRGAVLGDPITEWLRRGTLPGGLSRAYEGMATLTKWSEKTGSPLRTVGVQAALWAEVGRSAEQELAFGLATGVDYLRALGKRGVAVDRGAPRFVFTFALGSWCYAEVAKLRAARRLWARAVAEMGGAADAQRLLCHGRIAGGGAANADPQANLLRVTSATFAGAVGGCAGLHVEANGEMPDDLLQRLKENVGSGAGEAGQPDCAAGPAEETCRVEALSRQLEERAWALFQEVEQRGGMAAAVSIGFPQELVEHGPLERLTPAELTTGMPFALHRAREIALLRRSTARARGREILARLGENQRANARTKMAALLDAFACGATLGEAARVLYQGGTGVPAIKPLRVGRH